MLGKLVDYDVNELLLSAIINRIRKADVHKHQRKDKKEILLRVTDPS